MTVSMLAGFDWEALLNRTMPAPLAINVRGEEDVSMFDEYDDDDYLEYTKKVENPYAA